MLLSIGLLGLFGYLAAKLTEKMKLPGLVGLLVIGSLLGPYFFNVLQPDLLSISQDLRTCVLILLLLQAGLGLKKENLKKIGFLAIKMSSIPCIFEGIFILGAAYYLLDFNIAEAGMLGFIIAAVSPAILVPSMLELIKERLGEDKQIPALLLAGASIDDVFAITLFSVFLGLGTTERVNIVYELGQIPISIIVSILAGAILACVLIWLFKITDFFNQHTDQLVVLLASALLFYVIGEGIGIAGLLGILAVGFVLRKYEPEISDAFSNKLAQIWVFAQIILFTLVGAEVDVAVALQAGLVGLMIIMLGLIGRSLGVWIATARTALNNKERLFCIIAYLPKATVQAAIGSLPLAAGVSGGSKILAIAILSIVVTAPLGAIGIKVFARRLLV
ncbi:sodium/proton antiporter, CPA1 family (TC 2.A.36) [Amphibacillus marinus]|uniref:Sodium/proton antiporter, CPA1 family (TC 2.A.36) n=1 Tax=Amphibacillus marinus TaxID=872970 RepID=A0A1H8IKY2_9BACI|nr:cation:proton antiporter [Amphibacillus marinus]SEN69550.1 sodium/proton antiporter, CPA1 family (TC 2.A.36) [Amphibacillus marinus]